MSAADGPSIEEAMERARPDETGGAVLARARVAGALFGVEAASRIGRFRILERFGAGGALVDAAARRDPSEEVRAEARRLQSAG